MKFRRQLFICLSQTAAFVTSAIGSTAAIAANVPNPCVDTIEKLHAAFELASSGEEFNTVDGDIRIVVGTYAINNSYFQYGSSDTKTLDVSGGWNSDCSKQLQDPRLTTISGVGSSKLLIMSNSAGTVEMRYLTFKGGNVTSGGSALSMNTAGSMGQITLDNDIFTANVGGESVVDIGGSTSVEIDNNLFYSNTSSLTTVHVGNSAISGSTDKFAAINNTLSQNTSSSSGGQIFVTLNGASTGTFSNNIVYGNDFDRVFFSGGAGSMEYKNNDAGALTATGITLAQSGNLAYVDPHFVSTTVFHVEPNSPVLTKGLLTPTGTALPTIDLDGHPREWNGKVDIGAYELGDEIFKDGFNF